MPGKIIAVVNRKGGVGKTAVALALTDALVNEQEQVALVDLDPQGSATRAVVGFGISAEGEEGRDPLAGRPILAQWLSTNPLHFEPFHWENFPGAGIKIVANSDESWQAEDQITTSMLRRSQLRSRTKQALAHLAQNFKYIIVDCPPGYSIMSEAAIRAADLVLVPVTAQPMSIWGLRHFESYLQRVYGGAAYQSRWVINRFSETVIAQRMVEEVKKHPGPTQILKDEFGDPITLNERIVFAKRAELADSGRVQTFDQVYRDAATPILQLLASVKHALDEGSN